VTGTIRVCHLLHHLALGGIERQLIRQIGASRDSEVEYTVGYFGTDEACREPLEAAGARTVHVDLGTENPLSILAPWNVARVAAFVRRGGFDVLHCHTSLYLVVLGRAVGLLAGVPVVATYHNTRDLFDARMAVLESHTRRLSAVNLAVSADVERSYAGSARVYDPDGVDRGRRTYTVHNGIDVVGFEDRVAGADAESLRAELGVGDGPVFLTVGRYAPVKNQVAAVRAFPAVLEALPDAHLLVVGFGSLEGRLRRAAADCDVADRVTVTGRVAETYPYYALGDVFVTTSRSEGLSVAVLEAMAAGLPVVATRVAGVAETVADGETGVTVPHDDDAALASALRRAATPSNAPRMGEAGRRRARDRFDVGATARTYEGIYRRAADGWSRDATGRPATVRGVG
jgi:glycosyltransferase involved in cell wall biosynthesis